MRYMRRFAGAAFLGIWVPLGALSAQSAFGSRGFLLGGIDTRGISIGDQSAVSSISQVTMPFGVVFPLGLVTIDIGSTLASTVVVRRDRPTSTITSLTDTQIRAAYVFGQDAFVATLLVNLPTGRDRLSEEEQVLLSTVSSSFLSFPVNSYGNGGSLTAGLAGVTSLGSWNVGVAASARFNAKYTPFIDQNGPFTYRSGFEGRLRAGVDRLIGSSRIAFGVTASTFGDDEFRTGGGVSGVYRPGTRFIVESSWAGRIGTGVLTLFAWDFYRNDGDSTGVQAANNENLFAIGANYAVPLTRSIVWEPSTEFRVSAPETGQSRLTSLGSTVRFRVGANLSLIPQARVEFGRLETLVGRRHRLRGWAASLLLRQSF